MSAQSTEPAPSGSAPAEAGAASQALAQQRARGVRRTLFRAVGLVVFMGALSFAAVPFYDYICRVTGFSGTTQRAETGADRVVDRIVTVRFDASVHRDMRWRFEPVETEIDVRVGETTMAFYRATNPTDVAITGSSTFNVTPFDMGGHFAKIACFCFEEQTLQPGESIDMPVTFYIDPSMLEDPETRDLRVVTLSYTFFEVEQTAAGATPAAEFR